MTKTKIDIKKAFTTFPNGEKKVNRDYFNQFRLIENFHYEYSNRRNPSEQLVEMIMLAQHFEQAAIDSKGKYYYVLSTNYIPYSRADKLNDHNLPFFKLADEYFNNLNHVDVIPMSQHSLDFTNERRKTIINVNTLFALNNFVKEIITNNEKAVIVFPDEGAKERFAVFPSVIKDKQVLITSFKKTRDEITGRLKITETPKKEIKEFFGSDIEDVMVIIVDDIISYGGTIKLVASEINKIFNEINPSLKRKPYEKMIIGVFYDEEVGDFKELAPAGIYLIK